MSSLWILVLLSQYIICKQYHVKFTAQKMKFFIKDFFSKVPFVLKKSLMENFIFCDLVQAIKRFVAQNSLINSQEIIYKELNSRRVELIKKLHSTQKPSCSVDIISRIFNYTNISEMKCKYRRKFLFSIIFQSIQNFRLAHIIQIQIAQIGFFYFICNIGRKHYVNIALKGCKYCGYFQSIHRKTRYQMHPLLNVGVISF